MKFSKTNSIYSLIILLGIMIVFNACQKENSSPTNSEIDSRITEISESQLPLGVIPLRLNSKSEMYTLIEKLDTVKLNVSFSSEISTLPRLKNRSEVPDLPGITNVDAQLAEGYDIVIHLAYERKGQGPIFVSSDNKNTWVFSSWTQTAGVANWRSANSINYAITGIIKWYIIIQTDLFEVNRREMSVSGDEAV